MNIEFNVVNLVILKRIWPFSPISDVYFLVFSKGFSSL